MTIPTATRAARTINSGQPISYLVPYDYHGDVPAVIYQGGLGSDDTQILSHLDSTGAGGVACEAAARAGLPVVGCRLGGGTLGNDTGVGDTAVSRNFSDAVLGADSSEGPFLMGLSGGFLNACNYAKLLITVFGAPVRGIIGLIFAHDLEWVHSRTNAGNEAAIDAAYGDHAGYLAAIPDYSPMVYGPTVFGGADVPMLLCRASDDAFGANAEQSAFVEAMEAVTEVTEHVFTGGHTIGPASTFDPDVVTDWLEAH